MNSWLLSMRWPDFSAIARAIATASVSESIASASAIGASCLRVSPDGIGMDRGGRLRGMADTIAMCAAGPNTVVSASA